MKVFAVIVTHNGMSWIEKCLESLRQSAIKMEIVVIDNNSSDNTLKVIRRDFPEVALLPQSQNLGFGKANNIGISYALKEKADYFLLLNQDAWVEDDTISKLISIQKRNADYGILSPMHLNAKKTAFDFNFLYYLYHTQDILSDIYLRNAKDVYETEFVNAAIWLISKECINKVGVFDPLFYHYSEDRNYCQRVLYHGLKVGICPGINAVHDRDDRARVTGKNQLRQQFIREQMTDLVDIRNENFDKEYKKTVTFFKKELFKGILGLNINKIKAGYNGYNFFIKKKQEMLDSRNRNKTVDYA